MDKLWENPGYCSIVYISLEILEILSWNLFLLSVSENVMGHVVEGSF